MLWTNPLHIQYLCKLVEAAMKVVAELHEVLYVKYIGEVDLQATPASDHDGRKGPGRSIAPVAIHMQLAQQINMIRCCQSNLREDAAGRSPGDSLEITRIQCIALLPADMSHLSLANPAESAALDSEC